MPVRPVACLPARILASSRAKISALRVGCIQTHCRPASRGGSSSRLLSGRRIFSMGVIWRSGWAWKWWRMAANVAGSDAQSPEKFQAQGQHSLAANPTLPKVIRTLTSFLSVTNENHPRAQNLSGARTRDLPMIRAKLETAAMIPTPCRSEGVLSRGTAVFDQRLPIPALSTASQRRGIPVSSCGTEIR